MKKTVGKLIVAVQSKIAGSKRSSKNINAYVNKVPCKQQQLNKPSDATIFVNQEMNDYPLPPKQKISKRQQILSEKIKGRLQLNKLNQRIFNELVSKLEQKLTFLELEEMRQLLQFMNDRQINQNSTGLKKLKNVVNYFLESSQQNTQIQNHIIESANKLINQIKEAQKKKVNQLV